MLKKYILDIFIVRLSQPKKDTKRCPFWVDLYIPGENQGEISDTPRANAIGWVELMHASEASRCPTSGAKKER